MELRAHPAMQTVFNRAADFLDSKNLLANNLLGRPVNFALQLRPDVFHLCGEPVAEVDIHGTVCLVERSISSQAVLSYGPPERPTERRDAVIQRYVLGETSIVHDANRIY